MNNQEAKAFVAALTKTTPLQRATAWEALTPEDRRVAWDFMTPDERDADLYAFIGVEGQYWTWTEENFELFATRFRAAGNDRAAAIVDRLVATTDDVLPELMSDYHKLGMTLSGDMDIDDRVLVIHEQMMEEIGHGEFAPTDATGFVLEKIRRVSGMRMS
jgi:hypothetical protein